MFQMAISSGWHTFSGYVQTNKNTQHEKQEEEILVRAGIFYWESIPVEDNTLNHPE